MTINGILDTFNYKFKIFKVVNTLERTANLHNESNSFFNIKNSFKDPENKITRISN